MDRFQNGNGGIPEGPLAEIQMDAFSVSASFVAEGDEQPVVSYQLSISDSERGYVDVTLNSVSLAQLVHSLGKAAIASCDESFLTMLMVMMTETPAESVEKLFETGHAKDNLES